MIGIDTNVLLRFLLADDPDQLAVVERLFAGLSEAAPAYISLVVVVETVWNLGAQGYKQSEIAFAFRSLLDAEGLLFEDEDFLDGLFAGEQRNRADFSDHIIAHLAQKAGCVRTVTFDRKAARRIPEMELLQ